MAIVFKNLSNGGSSTEVVLINMTEVAEGTKILTNAEVEKIKNGAIVKYGEVFDGGEMAIYMTIYFIEIFDGQGMIIVASHPTVTDNTDYIEYEQIQLGITITGDDKNSVADQTVRQPMSKYKE